MTWTTGGDSQVPDDTDAPGELATPPSTETPSAYLAPRIVRLGTLAELTQGGVVGPDDGLGGAGDGGSL